MSKKKPELYIVHGWTTTTDNWQKTLGYLRDRHNIKVHFLNVPGLTTTEEKEYTIKDYANWASKTIPPDAIVLGHSNGGRILMNAVVSRKLKPKKLILLNSAGVYYRSWKARAFMIVARWLGWAVSKDSGIRTCVRRLARASDYAKANEGMKCTLENMIESDRDFDFSKVNVPTNIIWGSRDKFTPLKQGRKIAAGIPNNTFEVIEGWGHSPYYTNPAALATKIAEKVKAAE
ncbi:alpha/beta hydrolase [Candidatus Saccharibacteria bacterium]|nr:alpha/beta hydrolase [Candidatus Saccharibacteria bacterium]